MPKIDIHQYVTDSIVAAIEAGAGETEMPWNRAGVATTMPINVSTGKPYNGVNVLMLWAEAEAKGYDSGTWGTYKQWQEKEAQVRKGEKSTSIVFYKELPARDTAEDEEEDKRFVIRSFRVFNADQVDGWKEPDLPTEDLTQRLDAVEAFIAATGAEIRHGGGRAFYQPSTDTIQMPNRERFTGTATSSATEGYYGVKLHELTHWSGHESRLNRDLSGRFGKEAYAMEELVAELGSAFLCAEHHITPQPRPDHAAYIANWLQVLKDDKRAIFTAASKASQASQYLGRLTEQAQGRPDVQTPVDQSAANDDLEQRETPDAALWQQRVAPGAGRQLGLF